MLKRLHAAALIWLAAALPVWAACGGSDLIEAYRADDPAGIDAMFARAHAVHNSQGLLWKVTSPGGEVSHLFGTFHTPQAVDMAPDGVWPLLDGASLAVFEVDLENKAAMEARMASDPAFLMDATAGPLADRLPEGTYPAVRDALAARGVSGQVSSVLRPWLLVSLLGFPPCHLALAQSGAEALDLVMTNRAAANGTPILGLETYEEGIAVFQTVDRELLHASIAASAILDDLSEDILHTNQNRYAAQDIQTVLEFSIWLAERHFPGIDHRAATEALLGALLEGRNRKWMPALTGAVDQGGAFVAVGALHLPGDAGLVELLRDRGYIVERVD